VFEMRVTQSMLSNNLLRNLSNSYSRLGKLQEQLSTQKKITRPSDDPVVAMLGMGYRTDTNRIEQFKRNIGEVKNWIETTDDALDHAVNALQRIRELIVQASNGIYDEGQRSYIGEEIEELKKHIQTIGNTQMAGKYIFNGTETNVRPDGNFAEGTIEIEVFQGIKIPINTNGKELFGDLISDGGVLDQIIADLQNGNVPDDDISNHIAVIDEEIDRFLSERASIGARQNRVDLMEERLGMQEVISKRILSDNEDIDIEKAIMDLTIQESILRASLSVGSRIIQPTLVDFLR
jgi:flagellar hook-associated protein 3 FlgL